MQIYREYLRIDGDFYNLLALSGRNLINLFYLRIKLRFVPSTPQYIATIPSARSVLSH